MSSERRPLFAAGRAPALEVRRAMREADVLGAQRLRYEVFVAELGGDGDLVDHARRLERDAYDPHYDHLVLVDPARDEAQLKHVVGAYRLMPGGRAAAARTWAPKPGA